jgi:fido (protein-threonine AMPylation protein)
MLTGITKTEKIHLFDDRNLKSLIRVYNWTGQQRQKDIKKKKTKMEESVDFEEVKDRFHSFFKKTIFYLDGSGR